MTEAASARVWVFFYGSYMDLEVLRENGLTPTVWEVARAPCFDIQIGPRANLIHSERDVVWGINCAASHAELGHLYGMHGQKNLGEVYLPEAILTYTGDGQLRPVLTYLCHDMTPREADSAYLERIIGPARRLGFPAWYIERLESFRPK